MLNTPHLKKVEFARLAGVSAAAVTNACKASLAPAFDGKLINTQHPAAREYLRKKTGDKSAPLPTQHVARGAEAARETKKSLAVEKAAERVADGGPCKCGFVIPENLQEFANLTLGQIISHYGTDVAFLDWLKATKTIEDIEEKRLRNSEKRGTLVSRELVKKGVIDTVNETHLRMLSDGAKSIAGDVSAMVLADETPSKLEQAVSERLTKFIKPAKSKMIRVLKNA